MLQLRAARAAARARLSIVVSMASDSGNVGIVDFADNPAAFFRVFNPAMRNTAKLVEFLDIKQFAFLVKPCRYSGRAKMRYPVDNKTAVSEFMDLHDAPLIS